MAGYNEILAGRFNRALQKLFSMKGPASMNELASVMSPQIVIHTDADQRFLESWDSFGAIATSLPTAVNGSSVRLRNPANSGVIAVVTRIQVEHFGGAAADSVVLEAGAQPNDLAGSNGIQGPLDMRTKRFSSLIISINPVGGSFAFGNPVWQVTAQAAPNIAETLRDALDGFQRVVLVPGFALQLRNSQNNQAFGANFLWEERAFEVGEV